MSRRYNTAKPCKKCGCKTSVIATRAQAQWKFGGVIRAAFVNEAGAVCGFEHTYGDDFVMLADCRGCGAPRLARAVIGRHAAHIKCDGRCESATGHNCECSCGGANHGARHAA